MSSYFAVVNQTIVPEDQARLLISDLAIQRGYGIFDFFKTLQGRPIFLQNHLRRFYRSAERMRLPIPLAEMDLKALLGDLFAANHIPDSGVRITLTGGYSPDGYSIAAPNLLITQRPLPDNRAAARKGIGLMTFDHQRQLPDVKTIDYLMAVWLAPVLREKGADDVLYHRAGIVAECPRANVFFVTREDKLITPGKDVLHGVIRQNVLELAGSALPVEERDIRVEELREVKEAFITSTTKNVFPVVALDSKPVGNGEPGPMTLRLAELLGERISLEMQ